jgi:hypothetical protein
MTVRAAVARAAKLDGAVVCLRGWIWPIRTARGEAFVPTIREAGDRSIGKKDTINIGVIEGSAAPEMFGELYRPESFDQIDSLLRTAAATPLVIEVEYMGVLTFRRGLLRSLADRLPPDDPLYDTIRRVSPPVEFVLLQVRSAKVVRHR